MPKFLSAAAFFVTGGTLRRDAPSYVKRQADVQLREALLRSDFCYVLTARQMGKSSLMVQTAGTLREQGVTVIVLDLTRYGTNLTPDQWYAALVARIGEETDSEDELETVWDEHAKQSPLMRFTAVLRHLVAARSNSRFVIFIDEIDIVRTLPFATDELFVALRELYTARAYEPDLLRLTFCLLGVASPADLIQDTRITPFNIGTRIELKDFEAQEAAPLTQGLQDVMRQNEAAVLLTRVLHWTGGQPYMTQRLCLAVAETLGEAERSHSPPHRLSNAENLTLVDTLCHDLFLTQAAQETDSHLTFVRNRLLRSEADLASLLDLYQQVRKGKRVRDSDTDPLCALLKLSGIVKAKNGLLTERNEIYKRVFNHDWVIRHFPNAELRRQQRAYRIGLFRAAIAGAGLLTIVAGLGARAYFSEQKAKFAQTKAQTEQANAQVAAHNANLLLYDSRMNLIQRAYQEEDIGQARELLEETADAPNRGFEWHYWNNLLKRERLAVPNSELQSLLTWSRDGRWIVTQNTATTETPRLTLRDAQTGEIVRTLAGRTDALIGVSSPVSAECVVLVDAPQGKAGTVRLVNPATGETRQTLPVQAHQATLSGDGKRAFTLERLPNARTTFKAWSVQTGTLLCSTTVRGEHLFGTAQQTATVQSTRDSRLLCFGSAYWRTNSPLTLLETTTGKPQWTPEGTFNRYALSPSGRLLVATRIERHIPGVFEVWDLQARRQTGALNGQKPQTFPNATGNSYLVLNLRFSPDERRIVGAGTDANSRGKIFVWNSTTGKEEAALAGHRAFVFGVEFSPDGKWLFSSARDNSLRVWNATTWEKVGVYSSDNTNLSVFAPNSKEFLALDRRALRVYPIETRRAAEKWEFANVWFMQFHPDNRHLHLLRKRGEDPKGFYINRDMVYDFETRTLRILSDDQGTLNSALAANPYAVNIKSVSGEGFMLTSSELLSGKPLGALPFQQRIYWIAYDWPGVAMILYDGNVPFKKIKPQNFHRQHPQVVLWDGTTGKEWGRLSDSDLAYVPWKLETRLGTQVLVIVDTENVAHFWQTRPLRERFQVSLGSNRGISIGNFMVSPDGKQVCVVIGDSFFDARIEVRDLETGKQNALQTTNHAHFFQPHLPFSPDGHYRLWADLQQSMHIMECATGRDFQVLKSLGGDPTQAVFSPDGKRVLTSTNTGILKLWDVETGAELMVLSKQAGEFTFLAFSPDGTRLGGVFFTGAESRALVWDTRPPQSALSKRD